MTPNLPSLNDTATRRSPSFASRSGAFLKSSAAPTSIHSPASVMSASGNSLRDHISYTLAAHGGSPTRTADHAPCGLAPAPFPPAALHHLLAGPRQRRLRQAADERR